jgi:hypothetical protein
MSASLKPAKRTRLAVWGATAGLFISGIALQLPTWWNRDFEPSWGPDLRMQGSRVHAAFGMAFLVVLGSLAGHVADGLRARRNTVWGLALLASLGILILSAWGLYYLPEDFRASLAKAHLWSGLSLPFLILLHAVKGRR